MWGYNEMRSWNFSRYCLLTLWKQKYHDQHKYGGYSHVNYPTPQAMIKQKKRLSFILTFKSSIRN